MSKKTIAEMVAARFQDDGSVFEDANGSRIEDVAERAGGLKRTPKKDTVKFVFADASAIVIAYQDGIDDAWDFALDPLDDDCDCMVSEGPDHLLSCHERRI